MTSRKQSPYLVSPTRSIHHILVTLALLVSPLLALVNPPAARAASLVVTNTNASGAGSFRQAYLDAAAAGDDTITFDASLAGQTITLDADLPAHLSGSGSLTINGLVDASGQPDITLDGGGHAGIQYWGNGSFTLNDLRLTGFRTTNTDGTVGAVLLTGTEVINVTLTNCIFDGNTAELPASAYDQVSAIAALYAGYYDPGPPPGSILVDRCIFANNSNTSLNTTRDVTFGALFTGGHNTPFTVANSLFYNNTNTASTSRLVDGAAITSNGTGFTLVNTTIVGNAVTNNGSGPAEGAAIEVAYPVTVDIYNSILIDNGANQVAAYYPLSWGDPVFNYGNSLTTGPVNFVDVSLGDLANHHDFRLASTAANAIDAGDNAHVVGSFDLAGRTRVANTTVDIGAYEFQLPVITGNAGAAGATLGYDDGGPQTATADGSGDYSFTVPTGWSGTVTPSLDGYAFTPASRSYTNVTADQPSQDYTATAVCAAVGDGDWSVVFAACPPGANYVIPAGVSIRLDIELDLAGDLEVQGSLDATSLQHTVTLTGAAAQTLTGNPLAFYRLTLNKTDRTDTVAVSGRLQVSNKLTVTRGKLVSASDYGDLEIGVDGEMELSSDISVGGNWTNDGTFTHGNHAVTFDGTAGVQTIGGATQTAFYDLVIEAGAKVFMESLPAATNSVTNNGVISQTQAVGPGSSLAFLAISETRYQGVDLVTDGVTDLGQVSVAVQGNTTQCTTDAGSPPYRDRCIWVTSQNEGTVNMTAYSTALEDDIDDDVVYQYYPDFFLWAAVGDALANPCTADGEACLAENVNLLAGDNHFLIGNDNNSPTAVAVHALATETAQPKWGLLLLAFGSLLAWLSARIATRRARLKA